VLVLAQASVRVPAQVLGSGAVLVLERVSAPVWEQASVLVKALAWERVSVRRLRRIQSSRRRTPKERTDCSTRRALLQRGPVRGSLTALQRSVEHRLRVLNK
jgi:hypothetical protein